MAKRECSQCFHAAWRKIGHAMDIKLRVQCFEGWEPSDLSQERSWSKTNFKVNIEQNKE